ncbi:MAG TPA: RNA polymerase sigma factor [Candidatus Acidoferrales bacterium]|nr:RNA polymerase sigma factor [Candidatus Acidoferrales bacterium]
MELLEKARCEGWTDEEVVERVLAGETALYEIILRRYNQRLYRVVRAILRDEAETEDVMQDAYVRAYQHLEQFERRAAFSTWLTRIAVHEALARVKKRSRTQQLDLDGAEGESPMDPSDPALDPEQDTSRSELSRMLEDAIMGLPDEYRAVLMLRDVEELSTAETAAALNITEENVKVRLFRSRAMVRKGLYQRVGGSAKAAFPFMGTRCDRVVERVFKILSALEQRHS